MMGFILCDGGVVSNCLIAVKLLPTGGRGGNNNCKSSSHNFRQRRQFIYTPELL